MPYRAVDNKVMVKRGNRWVVLKVHPTAEKAKRHARALNANVHHS